MPFEDYILDFVGVEAKLIVEVDGSQHEASVRDKAREAILSGEGFQIVRYWNNDVLQQASSVLDDILAKIAPHAD